MLCLSTDRDAGPSTGPFAWGKGSCLELVFARDAWQDAWLRAEDQDGQEQLADILDRPNAWDPSPSVAENMPYQQTLQKGNSRWGSIITTLYSGWCWIPMLVLRVQSMTYPPGHKMGCCMTGHEY